MTADAAETANQSLFRKMRNTHFKCPMFSVRSRPHVMELVLRLPALARAPIKSLRFVTYKPSPGLKNRLPASKSKKLVKILEAAVKDLRINKPAIPYWEASILAGTWMTMKLDVFIEEALRHLAGGVQEEGFTLLVSDLNSERLKSEMAKAAKKDHVLALCSKCELHDGSIMHLPMMDFGCPIYPKNLTRVKAALKKVGQSRGFIVESGHSYHYYGVNLLSEAAWITFLAKSLLLAPLTDSRYIGHRLIDGVGGLRVSSNSVKNKIPKVTAIFGNYRSPVDLASKTASV